MKLTVSFFFFFLRIITDLMVIAFFFLHISTKIPTILYIDGNLKKKNGFKVIVENLKIHFVCNIYLLKQLFLFIHYFC